MQAAKIGYDCVVIAGIIAIGGVVQWKFGCVYWLGRHYRDSEPAEFYLTELFYLLLAIGLSVYGAGLILGWWVPS